MQNEINQTKFRIQVKPIKCQNKTTGNIIKWKDGKI